MNKIFVYVLAISLVFTIYNFVFINSVNAHLPGQPSFFVINGKYAILYPVPVTSLYDFDLPQDLGPENYLVNEPIYFELDKLKLPASQDVVVKTKFSWDFGDGSKGSGLIQSHTYRKIGSYVLNIYADDGTTPTPQLLEKVLINILPETNYSLPQSKILVNGKGSSDPLIDILEYSFKNPLQFDGNSSTGKIDSYFWDFGDQKSATSGTISHQFGKDLTQIFVVLRVKDGNGFISDNFLEVQNSDLIGGGVFSKLEKSTVDNMSNTPSQLKYTLIGIVILILGILLTRKILK